MCFLAQPWDYRGLAQPWSDTYAFEEAPVVPSHVAVFTPILPKDRHVDLGAALPKRHGEQHDLECTGTTPAGNTPCHRRGEPHVWARWYQYSANACLLGAVCVCVCARACVGVRVCVCTPVHRYRRECTGVPARVFTFCLGFPFVGALTFMRICRPSRTMISDGVNTSRQIINTTWLVTPFFILERGTLNVPNAHLKSACLSPY